MGYRNEVAIKCETKAYERFKVVLADNNFKPDKVLFDDGDYIIYFDWVKWYEDYPEVNAIYDVMNQLDDEHDGHDDLSYKFLRLGEDDADKEERTNDYDIELWPIRKIDLPLTATEVQFE